MNLRELRDRVFTVLRDTSREFVTNDDVDDWLSEAYVDVNARYRYLRAESTGTTTGDITMPTSPRVLEVLKLKVGTAEVEFTDDEVFDSFVDHGATPSNSGVLGRVFEGVIELYPAPVDAAYTLRYIREPVPLTGDDQSPELPEHLQVKMIRYAQAQAFLKMDQASEFSAYYALYEQGLPSPPGIVKPINPGPFVVTFEKGPFDLDPEARHY